MIKGIGHLGIVVEDIKKSLNALSQIVDLFESMRKSFSECIEAEMFFKMHLNPLHAV